MDTILQLLFHTGFRRIGTLCLLFLLVLSVSPLHAQENASQLCAASRLGISSRLLADGITSESHRALMQKYDMHWYKLDLQLEQNARSVNGNVIMYASSVTNNLSEFAFELHPNYTIQEVLLDGSPCTVRRSGSEVVAVLPVQKNAKDKFKVQVFYAGVAPSGASAAIGNGFNTAPTPFGSFAWSLSEPFAASEWFPCKQLLEDKADSVDVWVTTAVTNKVGSNGLLQRITPMGNQKHRYEWKSTYPIAYYLISVALGPYEEYTFQVSLPGAASPMPVQNYIYPGILASVKPDIDKTGPLLQVFSEMYGLYPFHKEKYGHSMAPMGGGMEHQTMTTQVNFSFTLTAHELAHQWWGDEVTCEDWSHIWLNEGFASYSEYLALERLVPAGNTKDIWLNNTHQTALIFPQGMVFVKDSTNVARIFNSALTYDKGAMVLHMLRHALAKDALFFQALQAYRQEYRYQVADTRDFQRVVERVAGRSFQYFFDQWVYGEGYPIFDIKWAKQDGVLHIRSTQTGSSQATPFFQTEVEYKITTTVKDTVVVLQQGKEVEEYAFKVPGTVLAIEVDPNQWLLNTVRSVQIDPTIIPADQRELSVYPNPTSDQLFFVGGTGKPDQVVLYDVVGRLVRDSTPVNGFISVADLRPGAYLIKAKNGQQETLLRFIKL